MRGRERESEPFALDKDVVSTLSTYNELR
jgi:hypothetical protein